MPQHLPSSIAVDISSPDMAYPTSLSQTTASLGLTFRLSRMNGSSNTLRHHHTTAKAMARLSRLRLSQNNSEEGRNGKRPMESSTVMEEHTHGGT